MLPMFVESVINNRKDGIFPKLTSHVGRNTPGEMWTSSPSGKPERIQTPTIICPRNLRISKRGMSIFNSSQLIVC